MLLLTGLISLIMEFMVPKHGTLWRDETYNCSEDMALVKGAYFDMRVVVLGIIALLFSLTICPARGEDLKENRNLIAMRYMGKVRAIFESDFPELVQPSSDLSKSLVSIVESRLHGLNLKLIHSDIAHDRRDARNIRLIIVKKSVADRTNAYGAQLILEALVTKYGTTETNLISIWQTEVSGKCSSDCSDSLRMAVKQLMDRFVSDYQHTKHRQPVS